MFSSEKFEAIPTASQNFAGSSELVGRWSSHETTAGKATQTKLCEPCNFLRPANTENRCEKRRVIGNDWKKLFVRYKGVQGKVDKTIKKKGWNKCQEKL